MKRKFIYALILAVMLLLCGCDESEKKKKTNTTPEAIISENQNTDDEIDNSTQNTDDIQDSGTKQTDREEGVLSEKDIVSNTENYSGDMSQKAEANIEIIAVSPCKKGMGDITVDFRINNIQDMRGCVYLKSNSNAFFTQMFFRDENHLDEYRADGNYSYDISWLNDGTTKYLNIRYGYGEFNVEKGWTYECSTRIYYRLAEDNGRISSNGIPQSEIFDIYDGTQYIGSWTLNPSGDLIEIDGDSEKEPFTKNTHFCSENGNTVSVFYNNGNCVFYLNGEMIGIDNVGVQMQDTLLYEIDADNGSYLITRYPNDEYVSISVVGRLDISIEGIYYP